VKDYTIANMHQGIEGLWEPDIPQLKLRGL